MPKLLPLLTRTIFLMGLTTAVGKDLPAFPGAEGFGANTPGGRGGKALFVSNLNDAGLGSLRAACETKGPRTIVFRVGGIIDLKSTIKVTEPFLTLTGQTAPGDGVCLRGHSLIVATHDVVIRYLRSRPGDISGKETDALGATHGAANVIFDHCSASWAVDENLSMNGTNHNVTLQWSIVSEALYHSVHHKGAHSMGSLMSGFAGVSLHHNIYAHNNSRNTRLGGRDTNFPPTIDFRNNVLYDWGEICTGMVGDTINVNYAANYIKAGPSSKVSKPILIVHTNANAQFFLSDNVVVGRPNFTRDNRTMFSRTELDGRRLITVVSKPFDAPPIKMSSAEKVYETILANAGAILPKRDAVDSRVVEEIRRGTGHIIDSQWEVGGWPEYKSARPPLDTDRDGMPDEWEKRHGLNPNDPRDANDDANGDGYTNLEEFMNGTDPRSSRALK
ncbi:MAG: pectate lyase [Verrucomicrobia bacterium]|nr:pectate lyase [Verrucomicrobiota bacterium]